jgi:hypothetical protein
VKLTPPVPAVIGKPFSPVALNLAIGDTTPWRKVYVVGEGVETATQCGSTLLLKTIVPTVSETGPVPPLVIVTQIGGSLVGLVGLPQPVWKTILIPLEGLLPVIL